MGCPTGTWKNSWRIVVSRWITSPSIAGCSGSPPLLIDAARPCRHSCGDRWFVDETYLKISSRWRYPYRAIDQFGQVIDVRLSDRRDAKAARRFFTAALSYSARPAEVTTDRAAVDPRVLDESLPDACHVEDR